MVTKTKYYGWHPEECGFMDYLQYFVDKKPVLDVGCGTGWLGRYHRHMYGIDNDKLAISKAKMFEKAKLCDLSEDKIPFDDSLFEGVILKDVIEHIPKPVSFIGDIRRVLKKKGLVFVSTKLPSKSFWDDYTHVRPYTKRGITSLLEDAGFEIIKVWYSGNWPGLGLFMRFFKLKKTPVLFNFLSRIGINRNNIMVLASKK